MNERDCASQTRSDYWIENIIQNTINTINTINTVSFLMYHLIGSH